jgi:hypothetical protein
MPGFVDAPGAYQVSEVFVSDRVAVLYWQAEVHGAGWLRTEHALCRRCGDDVGWFCVRQTPSLFVESSGGAFAEVYGISVEEAVKAVAFLRERSPSRRIVRLTELSPERTCVRFDPASDDSRESASLVLTRREGGFETQPAPDAWFDARGAPGMECGQMFYPDIVSEGLEYSGCAE